MVALFSGVAFWPYSAMSLPYCTAIRGCLLLETSLYKSIAPKKKLRCQTRRRKWTTSIYNFSTCSLLFCRTFIRSISFTVSRFSRCYFHLILFFHISILPAFVNGAHWAVLVHRISTCNVFLTGRFAWNCIFVFIKVQRIWRAGCEMSLSFIRLIFLLLFIISYRLISLFFIR